MFYSKNICAMVHANVFWASIPIIVCMGKMARMPTSRGKGGIRSAKALTLSDYLFYVGVPQAQKDVEAFRIKYEATHGETDLSKMYTSMWPECDQEWLLKHHPKRFFDGLPPFAKAWLYEKMLEAGQEGRLDDMPNEFVKLFLSRQMHLDETGPSR
jgi:hypothetical protein